MTLSSPLVQAALRAAAGAVVLAGVGFFGVLQADGTLRAAEIAAGVAFFGYLATRGVVEGIIDQYRAPAGLVPAPKLPDAPK